MFFETYKHEYLYIHPAVICPVCSRCLVSIRSTDSRGYCYAFTAATRLLLVQYWHTIYYRKLPTLRGAPPCGTRQNRAQERREDADNPPSPTSEIVCPCDPKPSTLVSVSPAAWLCSTGEGSSCITLSQPAESAILTGVKNSPTVRQVPVSPVSSPSRVCSFFHSSGFTLYGVAFYGAHSNFYCAVKSTGALCRYECTYISSEYYFTYT